LLNIGEIDCHTKVLCTAFICLQFVFVIFWQKDFGAKAAHKMLVKLTPGGQNSNLFLNVVHFCNIGVNGTVRFIHFHLL
jgi:hypothetical protein